MGSQGVPLERIECVRRAQLRYAGTDKALIVDFANRAAMRAAFEEMHRQRFGFLMEDKGLVIEAVSVEVIGHAAAADDPVIAARAARSEEHTSELQSLMRTPYAVFFLNKNTRINNQN